jgi:hypothetical protein
MGLSRLSLSSFVILATTLVLVVVISGALALRRRARTEAVRGLFSAVVVVSVLGGPVLANAIHEPFLRKAARSGIYIDPGPHLYFAPLLLAVFLLISARVLFPIRGDKRAAGAYRFCFQALMLGFLLLNMANWCQPGWCGRYGFPIAYEWWSDAMIIVNGVNLSAGFSKTALVVDISVIIATAVALAITYRRKHRPTA